jgi:hypothetical protein
MASVVVPIFRISEQSLGTAAATSRAMRILPSALRFSRCLWAMFSIVELGHPHATVEARQQAFVGEPLHIAAHRLQG